LVCVSPAAAQQAVPGPLGRGLPVYQPTASDTGRLQRPAVDNPTGDLALRDAVALALLHSPDLAAFAWETRAREARILRALRRPNPVVDVAVQDFGASQEAGDPTLQPIQRQTTIQLSQLVELGGKRTAREKLASLDRDLATWDYEVARVDVLTQVSHAFLAVLAAQETAAVAAQTRQLLEQVQQSVALRVEAGVVSPVEEIRARTSLGLVRVDEDRAVRALDASRRRLAGFWGAEPAFRTALGDLGAVPALPAVDSVKARLAANPDIARWAAEIARRQAAVTLERARAVPDVSISAGYRRYTAIDSQAFVVGGSIPLPLFDRNRGGIAEAESRVAKAYEERRAAEARATAMLTDAYRALSGAHAEVLMLREQVLPGSRQAFEAVSEGYRLGRFGYLEVLDAQRMLVTATARYASAAAEYHAAAADVERLIGEPLHAGGAGSATGRE
jgi:cobalt-zinc-cadmium efflux system outer membrane protein